jgi:hypothetical protein
MGFNTDQTNEIIRTIKYYQTHEPFTDEQIKEYMRKLNDISQVHHSHFDIFMNHMAEHLEGLHNQTFKQWVDTVYEKHKERVETDDEYDSDSDWE